MLTLAEEVGLGGFHLNSQVRRAFAALTTSEVIDLLAKLRTGCLARHLVYLREGEQEVVSVFPCPIAALPDQISYLHYVSLTLQNALKRLPDLYFQDFAVREALRLPAEEEEWLLACWGPSQRDNNPIFGRLDAVIEFTSPMWKNSLKFMEPNLSGIGGLHMVPTAERLVQEFVLPRLVRRDSHLALSLVPDMRDMLMQVFRDHLEAINHPARTICFVEAKYDGSGIDEQEDIARYYHDQYGLKVLHADPRELELRGAEVYYEDELVDLAYRDYMVGDLIALQKTGVDVRAMRALFQQNRMVSSIAAELDQKACWEVLTDPRVAERHFSADERQIFRRHVLWTRVIRPRNTSFPDGSEGDLLAYLQRERETLVIKPNRACGGEGVLIGPATEPAAWDAAIEQAVAAGGNGWVVQQLASLPVSEFPVVDTDGAIHSEPFHVVMGFAPTQDGVAITVRASQKQVVNVAQRGGMCVVLVGRPARPLQGPTPVSRGTTWEQP